MMKTRDYMSSKRVQERMIERDSYKGVNCLWDQFLIVYKDPSVDVFLKDGSVVHGRWYSGDFSDVEIPSMAVVDDELETITLIDRSNILKVVVHCLSKQKDEDERSEQ